MLIIGITVLIGMACIAFWQYILGFFVLCIVIDELASAFDYVSNNLYVSVMIGFGIVGILVLLWKLLVWEAARENREWYRNYYTEMLAKQQQRRLLTYQPHKNII